MKNYDTLIAHYLL